MDAHIENLHNQVIQTDAYKEVKVELDDLKEGQKELNEKVDSGFDKGRKRMDGIEKKVDDMAKEIKDMQAQMTNQHHEIMSAIKDKENDRLKSEIKEMMESKKTTESRVWDVVKIALGVIIVGGLAALGLQAS